ncbi:MAG TPA: methyltransferase, TIGR04325 family [Pyrinomonadaceae bacterium]|nr:methyltransferase, TIGR04325 family [Pyrinomonadaceae bacterium]
MLARVTSKIFSRRQDQPYKSYPSFEAALADSNSYEDPRLTEVVKEKTQRYRESLAASRSRVIDNRQTVQNMFVLSHVEPELPLNVLEVGGACGAAYFEMQMLLPGRISHWAIVETPAMAAAAKSSIDDPALSFHSDPASAVEALDEPDLVIAQGVLQYAPDPLRMLRDLFALNFSFLYITRTAVSNAETPIVIKQETELAAHGPGTLPNAPTGKSTQPLTLVSFNALVSCVPSAYELLFNFSESAERTLLIDNRAVQVRDVGFLARRQP